MYPILTREHVDYAAPGLLTSPRRSQAGTRTMIAPGTKIIPDWSKHESYLILRVDQREPVTGMHLSGGHPVDYVNTWSGSKCKAQAPRRYARTTYRTASRRYVVTALSWSTGEARMVRDCLLRETAISALRELAGID